MKKNCLVAFLLLLLICTACSVQPNKSAEIITGAKGGSTLSPSYTQPVYTQPSMEIQREWHLPSRSPYTPGLLSLEDRKPPLDIAYWKEWEEKSGQGLSTQEDIYNKFIELWKSEMDHALDVLNHNISREQLAKLSKSQEAWIVYIKNDAEIRLEFQYEEAKQTGERIGIYAEHGHLSRNMLIQRDRALQLIEYCYIIVGDYNYVFKGE